MEDLLRSKGLYQILSRKELELIDDENKIKWENKNDEARRLIGMSISLDLRFHLQGIDDLDDASKNIESMLGKHNIIRSREIENQIMTLSPNYVPCIEDYLSKFNTLDF
jgi:hypothetical protein